MVGRFGSPGALRASPRVLTRGRRRKLAYTVVKGDARRGKSETFALITRIRVKHPTRSVPLPAYRVRRHLRPHAPERVECRQAQSRRDRSRGLVDHVVLHQRRELRHGFIAEVLGHDRRSASEILIGKDDRAVAYLRGFGLISAIFLSKTAE